MNSNANVILSHTQLSQVLRDELHDAIFGTDKEWTIFSKTDELTIKTFWSKNNNCGAVLTEGIIHAPPSICQHALGTIDAFKDFNPFCQAMNCLENLDERTDIVHAIFSFPIPIKPREFCFYRYQSLASDPNLCVVVRSIDHPKVPENQNYVRGIFFTTGVLVEPVEGEPFKSRIYLLAQQDLNIEDPKVSKAFEEIHVTFGARVIPLLSEYINNSGLNRQKQYLTKMEIGAFKEMMELFALPPNDNQWKKVLSRQSLEIWSKLQPTSYHMCSSGVFTIDIPPRDIFDFIRRLPPGTLDPFTRTMYQVEKITDTISIWYISWRTFVTADHANTGDAVLLVSSRLLPGGGYMVLHRGVTHSRVPVYDGVLRTEVPPCGWFIHPANGGNSSLVSYCIQGNMQAVLDMGKPIQEIEQAFAVRTMSLVHSLRSLLLREQKNKELTAQIIQVAGSSGSESVYVNDSIKELLKLSHTDQQILQDLATEAVPQTLPSPREPVPSVTSNNNNSTEPTQVAVGQGSDEHIITLSVNRPSTSPPSSSPQVSPRTNCPCHCWKQANRTAVDQYFDLIKSTVVGCGVCSSKQSHSQCFCSAECQCDCSRRHTEEERPAKRAKSEATSTEQLLPSIQNFHRGPQPTGGKKFVITTSSESMHHPSELETIPNEIFLNIMRYLDHTSVGRLAQVNKHFKSLSEERLLWKDFFLSRYESKLPTEYDEHTFDFQSQYRAIIQKSINWRRGYFTKQEFQGHSKAIRCIEVNADYIVSGSTDKMVKVWDRKTGACIRTFYANNGGVLGISIDKNKVCTGYRTGALKAWDIASGSCTWEQNFGYYAEGFSFFNNKAATWDFSIDIWNLSTGQMERSLNQHTKKVNCVAIFNKPAQEPDETDTKWLASGSADKTIKIWNLQTGECTRTFQGHSAGVTALDLNDRMVVSGSNDKVIRVWDMKTGNSQLNLKGHTNAIKCLKIYDDKIVSGSTDNTVRVWTMKGDQHITLQAHQNITCLQVDNDQILAGCSDGTIIIWDFSAKAPKQTA